MISEIKDNYFMDLAIARAQQAANTDEVPVGAIVVINERIYSSDGNHKEKVNDPTGHAEILAIRHAAEAIESWRLEDATLYVTVEPCLMCTGAIYLARIPRVVFGCANPKGGALRFAIEHEQNLNLNHHIEVNSGARELECARLMREFFKAKRSSKLIGGERGIPSGQNSP